MAVQINTFAPETCFCVVQESYDDSIPENRRIHSLLAVLHRGTEHANVQDDSLFPVLVEESNRKRVAVDIAKIATGVSLDRIHWAFTEGRLLQISFTGLPVPANKKMAAQKQCNDRLGLNKVKVF